MSKFDDLFKKYNCDALSEQAVKQDIERILSKILMRTTMSKCTNNV